MGGIVARQMVADGFPCRALVSLCSPHHGLAPWVPTLTPGTLSLSRSSAALRKLNQHPRDIASREKYNCFSTTYEDPTGTHPHDGLVARRSALGQYLGAVASRHNTHLRYDRFAATDPHLAGMNAATMQAAIGRCAEIMAQNGNEPM
jgi:hypothetical protein